MNWICKTCAADRGASIPAGHLATWHLGHCDVCEQTRYVTEPRDFSPRPDRLAGLHEFDAIFAEIFGKADDGKAKA